MADPLVLVLAALSAVTTGLTVLFRLLMTEKDRSFARMERDAESRSGDLKNDNVWLREKLMALLENQSQALELIASTIRQQGEADKINGDAVRQILVLLRDTVDPSR